jgi:hypothetical protein
MKIDSIEFLRSKKAADVDADTSIIYTLNTLMDMEEKDFSRLDYIHRKIKRLRREREKAEAKR